MRQQPKQIRECRELNRSHESTWQRPRLARAAGAYVGTGRAAARQTALDFGAHEFVDLDNDALEDVGKVDLVFDVLGGHIAKRSAGMIRAGGTLVTIASPTEARPSGGLTMLRRRTRSRPIE
jgi:NADPH:quinone reductase-like Zn-dependent oxidoreductase